MTIQMRHVWSVVIGCGLAACAQSAITPSTSTPRDTVRSQAETQSVYVGNCKIDACALDQFPVGNFSHAKAKRVFVGTGGIVSLWVAFDTLGRRYMRPISGGPIAVYPAGATAGTAPQAYLTISSYPGSTAGIAIDEHDNIWVAHPNYITEYPRLPADAQGTITVDPLKTIAGGKTQLTATRSLVFDRRSGYLYVDMDYSILAFDPHDNGNVAPVVNISGNNTQINFGINAFAVDHKGRVLAISDESVHIFAPLATGNVAPITTFGRDIFNVATDAQDNIYVLENYRRKELLEEFASSAHRGSEPIQVLMNPVAPVEGFYPFLVH